MAAAATAAADEAAAVGDAVAVAETQLMVRRPRTRDWVIGFSAAAIALAALVAGSVSGNVHPTALHRTTIDPRIVGWTSAFVLAGAGVLATGKLSAALSRTLAARSFSAAAGGVRVLAAAVGYVFVLFAVLAVLSVSVVHLLIGAGVAGVVLGIAAQQSLGNVFAGMVLLLARPFGVGDHVRIRSGALGGVFDAHVHEMSLTYVTLATEDGDLKVPNSAMLAAGVLRLGSGAGSAARGSG